MDGPPPDFSPILRSRLRRREATVGFGDYTQLTTVSSFSSESARLKVDNLALHIVAKAKSPRSDPVLTLAGRDTFELLDGVAASFARA